VPLAVVTVTVTVVFQEFELDLLEWVEGKEVKTHLVSYQMATNWMWVVGAGVETLPFSHQMATNWIVGIGVGIGLVLPFSHQMAKTLLFCF